MNLEDLISTKERVKILQTVIYKTGKIGVSQLSRDLKVSKGLVSGYFRILVRLGVMKRVGRSFEISESIKLKSVRLFMNFWGMDKSFFEEYEFVKGVGVYGSVAKGENTEDSDIDMWLLVSQSSHENLAKLTSELRRELGNINPIYLTEEKIRLLRKEDASFYYSLAFGSILIYGKNIQEV